MWCICMCVYIYIYTHTYTTHHKEAVPWSVSLYYLWNACAAAHVCVCVYCVYIYSCVFMCVYAPTTSIIELHAPPPEGVNNKRGHTQTAILCVWSRARGPQHHHREWGAEGDNTHSQHSHNQTPTKPTHTREPRTR
jgi:hypothetical protein